MTVEKTSLAGDPAVEIAEAILDKPALVFAGQGSQRHGMGRELAEKDKEAMAFWKDAERVSGLPLREICWEGDVDDMDDTRIQQPAICVANWNFWRYFSQVHGLAPVAVAGHSLGEFSAITAAGVISPQSVIEIAALRGRLMAEADPDGTGAMAAIVKLDMPQVEELVRESAAESGELLVTANFNTPVQTVVSGTKKAVALACEKAKKLKGRAIELRVSGAFHSPMMEGANRELQKLLDKIEWKDPRFPVYCNATGQAATSAAEVKRNILRQMISPVYWVNLIRNLYLLGVRWWMEISPRAVLGKMIGPSLAGIAGQCDSLRVDIINSLSSIMNYTV